MTIAIYPVIDFNALLDRVSIASEHTAAPTHVTILSSPLMELDEDDADWDAALRLNHAEIVAWGREAADEFHRGETRPLGARERRE